MTYDYAIIGAGAAGLQLALAMERDSFFDNKRILLIDKSEKTSNDKTWCFWEKEQGLWDVIIHKRWNHGLFNYKKTIDLDLSPYTYKMLRAIDFYNHAKYILAQKNNFEWVNDEVNTLTEDTSVKITTAHHVFRASHVFDSRIDEGYQQTKGYNNILQHFKGWLIKTEKPVFKTDQFTMMDFNLQWKNSTSFTYILPFNPYEAIVEFTLFTPYLIEDISYDAMLNKYIEDNLGVEDYEVNHVEKGIIPMTDYPFHESSTKLVTKIGTAGSWVKASSGYSFKNAEKNSQKLVNHIKRHQAIPKLLSKKRFRFYDELFLEVLTKNNHLGPAIFSAMYDKNPTQKILRFLDEDSTIWDEIKIISTLPKKPFLQALRKKF